MDFLYAYISNVGATTLCHPIEIVKVHVQTSPLNVRDAIQHVARNRLFFKGLTPNLMTYPIFWGAYFQSRQYIDSSFVCGCIGSFVTNPLFVMKVRLQTGQPILFNPRVLYAGYSATVFSNIKLAVQFPLYDFLRDQEINVGVSSCIAKGVAASLTYPLDLARTNQRKNLNNIPFYTLMLQTFKASGMRGLYRGLWVHNCVSIPHFVIMMYGVEYFKNSN